MTAVLVIEDDGVIARAMGAHLRTSGFDVEWADDVPRASASCDSNGPTCASST